MLSSLRISIAAVVLVMSSIALAQSSASTGSWFGVSLPPGVGDPHASVVNVAQTAAPAAKVPAGEEKYQELNGPRIRRDVEAIVGFSRQSRKAGDKLWGRVTGFPAAKATIDWAAQQFKAAGLKDVAVQEYAAAADSSMWWATNWGARVIADPAFGAGSKDVTLETAVPTSGSMIAGATLTAALVDVGNVADAALPAVDVKGKIAVQHLRPVTGAYSERRPTVARAQELSKRGAAAIINVVQQTANMHTRDFGNCGAPCFNVGTADGAFIDAVLQRAAKAEKPVQVQLTLDARQLAGLKGHNAVGVVPGKSDEIIIVNAHADGWYDAAGDNADGLAVLVAMARHFGKPANRPDRTLVFVASGGHHSTGLNGPANFVTMNPELTAKTVLVLNLEHVAQYRIQSGTWKVEATEQPMNFGISNSAPFLIAAGKQGVQRYGFNLNQPFIDSVPGDLGGYAPLGVARVQAIHSGPMYHASGDVLETISVPGLERAARFYVFFVNQVTRASRGEINPT